MTLTQNHNSSADVARTLQVRQIKSLLDKLFQGKIDLSDIERHGARKRDERLS
jgi:hypothetical protein